MEFLSPEYCITYKEILNLIFAVIEYLGTPVGMLSRLIKTSGFAFIEDIRNAVRKDFNLFIGEKSAERVLMSLNELVENKEEAVCYGRDIVSGLPVEKHIPTDVIDMSMRTSFGSIADCVKQILERTPPELGADIYRHGIYLTGGASQAHNLAEYIADSTGIKVNVGEDPINSVVDGLAKIINEEKYRPLAYTTIEGLGTK